MNNNNEVIEVSIKNRTCHYFDDMININDLNLDNILLDEKLFEPILVYDDAYKTTYSSKYSGIIFDKIDEYIRIYDETKYLAFFRSVEKYDRIFNTIRYLIMLQSNISNFYSHKYTNIKINSDNDLLLEKH